MRNTLKASMAALLLSSVAIVSAATVVTFASADAAYAKSDNASEKSNGRSDAAAEKTRGKSGSSSGSGSATNRGYSTKLDRLLNKLTGQDKKSTRSASASAKPAKASGMHPSELGNMNGALHANENAILAHIRNGNTNGPVGLMAAFAAADYQAVGAEELLGSNLAAEYAALSDTLGGYESYEDYQSAYIGIGNAESPEFPELYDQAIEDANANIGSSDLTDALGGYGSYEGYQAAYIGAGDAENPEFPELYDQAIEEANVAVGFDQAAADSFAQAAQDEADSEDALGALVDYWNKGDSESDNADALRQELMDRVAEYEGVGETVDALEPEATAAEVCEGADPCSDDEMAELIE